jgi:IS5 family transposase
VDTGAARADRPRRALDDQAWEEARDLPRQATDHQRQVEIAVPVFGYKNHVGIDREHGFLRRYSITHAAAHDGGQLGAVLDRDNNTGDVWADTACRSTANLALLERRGLKPQFQRKKPRGRKMPAHIARGNATRARVRSRVEHVFAAQKCRLGLVVRTVGMVRAPVKIGLANLAPGTDARSRIWASVVSPFGCSDATIPANFCGQGSWWSAGSERLQPARRSSWVASQAIWVFQDFAGTESPENRWLRVCDI